MPKLKKVGLTIVIFIIIILISISVIFFLKNNKKSLTFSMYKNISESQRYTILLEGKDEEYSYKISIAQRSTDISIDMVSKYEDELEHTTTLVTDENAYFIMHNEEEYSTLDSNDIEIDILIPRMKDVDEKIYQKGKEEIKGNLLYFEEYEDISTYLMLLDINEDEKIKTRFYYEKGKLKYIKNIIEKHGEKREELIKAKCLYESENSLFEIPEDYAEI